LKLNKKKIHYYLILLNDKILETEKSALIDALDRDVWRSQSPGIVRSIFNNSRSYVSINNPSSKELK
jgi:hypothetical protein